MWTVIGAVYCSGAVAVAVVEIAWAISLTAFVKNF